jgi:hypothetical protein
LDETSIFKMTCEISTYITKITFRLKLKIL